MKTASATITTQATTALIAAVTGKRHFLNRLIVSSYAPSDTGTIQLSDSATTFMKFVIENDSNPVIVVDFGGDESKGGLQCAAGSAVNIVTATANPSIVVTAMYRTGA